jgi:hypothetical protein
MIGSPENNFNTMQPKQSSQPKNVMLGNALQNYNTPYVKDYSMGAGPNAYAKDYSMGANPNSYQKDYSMGAYTNQYAKQAGQNNTMPAGQNMQPYGFNAYAQGMNRSTGMQPQMPQPLQPQAIKY